MTPGVLWRSAGKLGLEQEEGEQVCELPGLHPGMLFTVTLSWPVSAQREWWLVQDGNKDPQSGCPFEPPPLSPPWFPPLSLTPSALAWEPAGLFCPEGTGTFRVTLLTVVSDRRGALLSLGSHSGRSGAAQTQGCEVRISGKASPGVTLGLNFPDPSLVAS